MCWGAPVVSAQRTGQLSELRDRAGKVGGLLAGECQFFALDATEERENEGKRRRGYIEGDGKRVAWSKQDAVNMCVTRLGAFGKERCK